MKIYRENPKAQLPEFATSGSACFDLRACFSVGDKVVAYNPQNKKIELTARQLSNSQEASIQIHPMYRVLVPTGLIFDIPNNHEMKIYIRSSMALKNGITLANSVAVIDSDYVDPTYVMIHNVSDVLLNIYDGDRIAQAQLVKLQSYELTERKTRPERKTERDGGLGSTGTA
jgi:dUTP pyrophosphatase